MSGSGPERPTGESVRSRTEGYLAAGSPLGPRFRKRGDRASPAGADSVPG